MNRHQALLPKFNKFLVVMPFEEGMCSDLVLIVGETTTALGQNLIEFIQRVKIFIDDGLVRQKRSAGWIWGEYGGRNISSTPSGTSRSLATCQPAPSSTRMMCLSGPPRRRTERAEQGGPSAMNPSPVAGRTKPYR